jgi:hypothetical protein
LGFARITLWIMAALIGVVMALAATQAQAHAGHDLLDPAATASAPISIHAEGLPAPRVVSTLKEPSQPPSSAFTGVGALPQPSHDNHGSCDCRWSCSCCSLACLTSASLGAVLPAAFAAKLLFPQGRTFLGVNPAAILRPPRTFA